MATVFLLSFSALTSEHVELISRMNSKFVDLGMEKRMIPVRSIGTKNSPPNDSWNWRTTPRAFSRWVVWRRRRRRTPVLVVLDLQRGGQCLSGEYRSNGRTRVRSLSSTGDSYHESFTDGCSLYDRCKTSEPSCHGEELSCEHLESSSNWSETQSTGIGLHGKQRLVSDIHSRSFNRSETIISNAFLDSFLRQCPLGLGAHPFEYSRQGRLQRASGRLSQRRGTWCSTDGSGNEEHRDESWEKRRMIVEIGAACGYLPRIVSSVTLLIVLGSQSNKSQIGISSKQTTSPPSMCHPSFL